MATYFSCTLVSIGTAYCMFVCNVVCSIAEVWFGFIIEVYTQNAELNIVICVCVGIEYRPRLLSLRGQVHFHFSKGSSIGNLKEDSGKLLKGQHGQDLYYGKEFLTVH